LAGSRSDVEYAAAQRIEAERSERRSGSGCTTGTLGAALSSPPGRKIG
jgi:hypothetical protein